MLAHRGDSVAHKKTGMLGKVVEVWRGLHDVETASVLWQDGRVTRALVKRELAKTPAEFVMTQELRNRILELSLSAERTVKVHLNKAKLFRSWLGVNK
jgi:hypothetical protein